MQIIKRNGNIVEFDITKIETAIRKANLAVDFEDQILESDISEIANKVKNVCNESSDLLTVENIQDLVENFIMDLGRYNLARTYDRYRYKRALARDHYNELMDAVGEKLYAQNVQNQNANVDERTFTGRTGEAIRLVSQKFARENVMDEKTKRNHDNNEIYTHDLDSFAVGLHNCLTLPIDKLLKNGFATRQGDVRSPNSIGTACQLIAVLFQLQSLEQFGGVSASHIDWSMVPYIRRSFRKHFLDGAKYVSPIDDEFKEYLFSVRELPFNHPSLKEKYPKVYEYALDMTVKETYQAVEALYHNLNTLQSRSGGQLPFSSINYGTCTLPEGRLFIKALLDTSINGIGKLHKTPIYPCGIFQMQKGVNYPGNKNYDLFLLALQSTSKRLYPNYANCSFSVNEIGFQKDIEIKTAAIQRLAPEDKDILLTWCKHNPEMAYRLKLAIKKDKNGKESVFADKNIIHPDEIVSTMGCRTFTSWDINFDFDSILKEIIEKGTVSTDLYSANQKDGRGNIAPITIILPTLAMQTKEDMKCYNPGASEEEIIEHFMVLLDKKIHEAKDSLLKRFEIISSQPASSAPFMYMNGTMAGYKKEDGIVSAIKHGTFAIGQLGLAEALQILIGCNHTTKKGMKIAKEIEQLYQTRCAEFKNKYKLNFGVYYTPAENLCYTAMKKFQKKYGKIPEISENDFFTNSIHVPVWEKINPFDKIDVEKQLTGYSSAGCITYVEFDGSVKNNLKALEKIILYSMENDIPYSAINVPSDTCLKCGFTDQIDLACPICGSDDIQMLRRVTGYLTNDYRKSFNLGKQQEVNMRFKHSQLLNKEYQEYKKDFAEDLSDEKRFIE